MIPMNTIFQCYLIIPSRYPKYANDVTTLHFWHRIWYKVTMFPIIEFLIYILIKIRNIFELILHMNSN
jgi:hypothetical protein